MWPQIQCLLEILQVLSKSHWGPCACILTNVWAKFHYLPHFSNPLNKWTCLSLSSLTTLYWMQHFFPQRLINCYWVLALSKTKYMYIFNQLTVQGSKNWGTRGLGLSKSTLDPSGLTRLQPVGPIQNKMCVCLDKRDIHSLQLYDSDCINQGMSIFRGHRPRACP